MAEIKSRNTADLLPDECETLINWRDCTHESLVAGLTMGQLLSLYHASAAYIDMESWLACEGKRAERIYKGIANPSR